MADDLKDVAKLKNLASNEEEVLFTFKGIFPFDFFPDVVTVYRNKISILSKTFFNLMAQTTNVPIENINYITLHTAFPFATLEISDRYFSEQPIFIRHLKRSEADQALRLIDGLRMVVQQKIDLSKIPKEELLREAVRIGVASPQG